MSCDEPTHAEFLASLEARTDAWRADHETARNTAERLGLDIDAICCASNHVDWAGMHASYSADDALPPEISAMFNMVSQLSGDLFSFIFASGFFHGVSWQREQDLSKSIG